MNRLNSTFIVPCLNEEASIAKVIQEIRACSPSSDVVVVDNGSTDRTCEVALAHGARVLQCPQRGKGRAVQYALNHVESDCYVLVDGDGTYDLSKIGEFISYIHSGGDMVVGQRLLFSEDGSFPRYHVFGNHLFSFLVSKLFGASTTDILSGLRAMSPEFVNSCPLTVEGFEMEAFYTLEAAVKGFTIKEIPIFYRNRIEGGQSKLRTFRDGSKILACIINLFRTYKPMPVFISMALVLFSMSLLSGYRPIMEFVDYNYVYAVPRAVLAAALMILSFLNVGVGLILSVQIRNQLQMVQMNRHQFRAQRTSSRRDRTAA